MGDEFGNTYICVPTDDYSFLFRILSYRIRTSTLPLVPVLVQSFTRHQSKNGRPTCSQLRFGLDCCPTLADPIYLQYGIIPFGIFIFQV